MAILAEANDVLIDLNGELAYLTDSELYIRDTSDTTSVGAYIISGESDLGEPQIEKLLNFVDIDYVGAFNLTFYLDGLAVHTMSFTATATRTTVWRDYPLSKRRPFQKLKLVIGASLPTTKIYGIEIDFSVLRRRRYN